MSKKGIINRSWKQFTLIELLVVIVIISILAGLLLPALVSVRHQANRVRAKGQVSAIVTAVKAFEAEYGYLPKDNSTTIIDMLACIDDPDDENKRNIKFLECDKNDEFKDPWGNEFVVHVNTDYDESISFDANVNGIVKSLSLKGSVFVYSYGVIGLDKLAEDYKGYKSYICSWE